jgi:uncharacterized protein (TIGR00661 family)
MKILYAIQGTGNGHISRARAIIPALKQRGEVDILLSGSQVDVALEHPVKYRCQGLGFIFGKKGGIDLMATYRKNKLRSFKKEIRELPVEEYDLVISDFEPVSAWACLQKGKACVSLSHQAAVLQESSPRPKDKDLVGAAFLNYYAPATKHYGFHFQPYEAGIFTPVIREGVRSLQPIAEEHYTVYLPAYSDKRIIEILLHFPAIQWEVFSKHTRSIIEEENVFVRPIHDNLFLQSMASSMGVLCGAGFETPAEALFLKKKLMVIPMRGQYEQQCNAAALKKMGVSVLKSFSTKEIASIDQWLDNDASVEVDYPDQTEMVIETVLKDWKEMKQQIAEGALPYGGKFRKSLFQKIVAGYIST